MNGIHPKYDYTLDRVKYKYNFPVEKRSLRDTYLTANLVHSDSCLSLMEGKGNLLFGEFALFSMAMIPCLVQDHHYRKTLL